MRVAANGLRTTVFNKFELRALTLSNLPCPAMAPSPTVVIDLCDDSDAEVPKSTATGSVKPKGRSGLVSDRRWANGSANPTKSTPAKSHEKGNQNATWKVYVPAQPHARLTVTPSVQQTRKSASEREAGSRKAEASATRADDRNGKPEASGSPGWRDSDGRRDGVGPAVVETGSGDELPSAHTFITPSVHHQGPAAKVTGGSQSATGRPDDGRLHPRKRPRDSDIGVANKRRKLDVRNDNKLASSSSDTGPGSFRRESRNASFGLPRRRKTPPRSQPGPTVDLTLDSPVKQSPKIISISSDEEDGEVRSPPQSKKSKGLARDPHQLSKTSSRSSKEPSSARSRLEEPRRSPTIPERSTPARPNAVKETNPRPRSLSHTRIMPATAQSKPIDTADASTKVQPYIPSDYSLKFGVAGQRPEATALSTVDHSESTLPGKGSGNLSTPKRLDIVKTSTPGPSLPSGLEHASIPGDHTALKATTLRPGLVVSTAGKSVSALRSDDSFHLASDSDALPRMSAKKAGKSNVLKLAKSSTLVAISKAKSITPAPREILDETNGQGTTSSHVMNGIVRTNSKAAKNVDQRVPVFSSRQREPNHDNSVVPTIADISDTDQGYGSLDSRHTDKAGHSASSTPIQSNLRFYEEIGSRSHQAEQVQSKVSLLEGPATPKDSVTGVLSRTVSQVPSEDGKTSRSPTKKSHKWVGGGADQGIIQQSPNAAQKDSTSSTPATGRLIQRLKGSTQHVAEHVEAVTRLTGTVKHSSISSNAQPVAAMDLTGEICAAHTVTGANDERIVTPQTEQLSANLGTSVTRSSKAVFQDDARAQLVPNFKGPDEAKLHALSLACGLSKRVEMIVGRRLEERYGDNEYWTRVHLKRSRARPAAKLQTKQYAPATAPASSFSFSNIRPLPLRTLRKEKGNSKVAENIRSLMVEIMSTEDSRAATFTISVPTTTFTAQDTMPTYAHAVGIKANFLASNVLTIHYMPYCGEGIDPDTRGLQEHYDIDMSERPDKLLRLAKAQNLDSYAEIILRDLGLRWDNVLRFLIEKSPDVGSDPDAILALHRRWIFCTQEFPLRQPATTSREDLAQDRERAALMTQSLRPSSAADLGKAAVLCDIFQRLAGVNLWHVARKHQSEGAQKSDDGDQDKTEVLDAMTCRVCMRLACPYHGEQDEGKINGENSCVSTTEAERIVSTDIINPPKFNYRTRVAFPPVRTVHNDTTESLPLNKHDRRSQQYWRNSNFIHDADQRGPFYPCHHPGKSCDTAMCTCFELKLACEKTCACSSECGRKFQGCACSSSHKVRKGGKFVCFDDERCVCFQLGRECDPDLCGACGVCEILDPVNRYNDGVQDGRCRNAGIQRGVPKRTLLGDSGIHGFGLYAGETINRHEFVGEYKGEIITKQEAERRGAVYEYQRLSYLFSLNKTQEIDSTSFGNKIRYINHTPAKSGFNTLYPRIFLVNTVHRIAMFAERKINKGQELLFDYGPQFPNEQLSSNAPHVRNADHVHDDFYDVEEVMDQDGNCRARKAVKASNKPRKVRAGEVAAQKRLSTRSGVSTKARKSAPEHDENGDEDGEEYDGEQQAMKLAKFAASRLQSYNISNGIVVDEMILSAGFGADHEEDDFEPEDSAEEASETGDETDKDEVRSVGDPIGRIRTRLRSSRQSAPGGPTWHGPGRGHTSMAA